MLGVLDARISNARARKCSQIGARTRLMLGKSMLNPTLVLQTEAINCPGKYIQLGSEKISPLFYTDTLYYF